MKDFFKQFPIFLVDLPRGAGLNTLNANISKTSIRIFKCFKKTKFMSYKINRTCWKLIEILEKQIHFNINKIKCKNAIKSLSQSEKISFLLRVQIACLKLLLAGNTKCGHKGHATPCTRRNLLLYIIYIYQTNL